MSNHKSVEEVVKAYRAERREPENLDRKIARLETELAEAREARKKLDAEQRPAEAAMLELLRNMPGGQGVSDFGCVYMLDGGRPVILMIPVASYWDSTLDAHFRSLGLLAAPEEPPVELTPPAEVDAEPVNGDLVEA